MIRSLLLLFALCCCAVTCADVVLVLKSGEVTPDTTAPTVTNVTVDGPVWTIQYNEPVTGQTGFTAVGSTTGAVTLTGSAGNGTHTHTFTGSAAAVFGETFTLDYTPGNAVDNASNALAAIDDRAVTNSTLSPGDVTAPTLDTKTIATSGTSATFVFSEVVYGTGGFTGTGSTTGALTFTYVSGSGTATHLYTVTRVEKDETVTVSYDDATAANDLEDESGNKLADITNAAVTNNSLYEPGSPDVTPPTITGVEVVNGDTWIFSFSEAVTGSGGFSGEGSTAGAITLNLTSGNGTSTHVYTGSVDAAIGETLTYDYDDAAASDDLEDAAGNKLADVTDGAVTNSTTSVTTTDFPVITPSRGLIIAAGGSIDYTPTVEQAGAGGLEYTATGLPTGTSVTINATTGQITGSNLTAGYYRPKITVTDDNGKQWYHWIAVNVYSSTVTVDQTWLDNNDGGTAPWYLDTANCYYTLAADVEADGTAFVINKSGVIFDLGGHTVTYDAADYSGFTVFNGDFETADAGDATHAAGWDFSGAPNIERQAGTFAGGTLYLGDYGLKITTPCADQEITNSTTVTLQPNTTYTLFAGMKKSSTLDDQGVVLTCSLVSDTLDDIVLTDLATGGSRGAFLAQFVSHTTGATAETYTVKVSISGAATASAGTVVVDAVSVQQYRVYGVAGVVNADTTTFPGVTEFGTSVGAAGIVVQNGTITQQGTGGWSHGVMLRASSSFADRSCEANDLTLNVKGFDTCCVANSGTPTFCSIYGGTYSSSNRISSNRHNGFGAVVQNLRGRIKGLTITDGPTGGIRMTHGDAGELQVTQCTVQLRTRYSNSFAIGCAGTGAQSWRNTVNCGTGVYGARGIAPGRVGTEGTPLRCWDNAITVQEFYEAEYGAADNEYTVCYGIQLESEQLNHVRVFSNNVTAYGRERRATAFRLTGSPSGPVYVGNNTFRVINDGNATAPVSFLAGPSVEGSALFSFEDNHLITDGGLAFELTRSYPVLVRSHIELVNAVESPKVYGIQYAAPFPTQPQIHTILTWVDTTFEDAGSETHFDNATVQESGSTTLATRAHIKKAWTTDLTIQGDSTPLTATQVDIVTAQGASAFSGLTDGSAKIAPTIAEWTKEGATNTVHNPHSVAVTGYDSGALTVDEADETATINLTPE